MKQDLRHAFQILLRHPRFTVVAVLTLALGIGANTAIFTIVNAVLLERLPFREPQRIVSLWEEGAHRPGRNNTIGPANFIRWRERSLSFDAMAAWAGETFTLSSASAPARQVEAELASAGYFEMLGARPVAGRTFTKQEDEERDAHPVALVSHGFAQREFGGAGTAIGRTIALNDRSFAVSGVLPQGFKGLDDDTDVGGVVGATVGFRLGSAFSFYVAAEDYVYGRKIDETTLDAESKTQNDVQIALGFGFPVGR